MAYESELALRLTPYVAGEQPKNQRLIKLSDSLEAGEVRIWDDLE